MNIEVMKEEFVAMKKIGKKLTICSLILFLCLVINGIYIAFILPKELPQATDIALSITMIILMTGAFAFYGYFALLFMKKEMKIRKARKNNETNTNNGE